MAVEIIKYGEDEEESLGKVIDHRPKEKKAPKKRSEIKRGPEPELEEVDITTGKEANVPPFLRGILRKKKKSKKDLPN